MPAGIATEFSASMSSGLIYSVVTMPFETAKVCEALPQDGEKCSLHTALLEPSNTPERRDENPNLFLFENAFHC